MSDDESANIVFHFALPGQHGMDGEEDDSGTEDSDSAGGMEDSFGSDNASARESGRHRLILSKHTTWSDYCMHLELLESRSFPGHGYLLTIDVKQKLDERTRFTGVETVDRVIHSYIPQSKRIGTLRAPLVLRPYRYFGAFMDYLHRRSIMRTICNDWGIANLCRNPVLQNDRNAVEDGSIVFFETLEIHPDHIGKDMALHLMHMALEFLDYAANIKAGDAILDGYARFTPNENFRWSLALFNFEAETLFDHDYVFPDSKTFWGKGCRSITSEKAERQRELATEKVCRHFARFGFRQAGHNNDEYAEWFLTRAMRDSVITSSSSSSFTKTLSGTTDNKNNMSKKRTRSGNQVALQQKEGVPTTRLWLEKSETASLKVYHVPSPLKRKGLRGQLFKSLEEFFSSKLQAEETLRENLEKFDNLIAGTKGPQEMENYSTVNEIQTSIQSVLEKSRREIKEAAETQLQAFRERFLHRELPALLAKCSKGKSTSASVINDMFALHCVLVYACPYRHFHLCPGYPHDCPQHPPDCYNICYVSDFVDCLKLLVKFGADVNLRDMEYGNTPLHTAQYLFDRPCYREIVEYLLSAGADPAILNGKNETPTDLLVKRRNELISTQPHCKSSMAEALIKQMLEDANILMPAKERDLLVDGWLSPRMSLVLSKKAVEIYVNATELISQVRGNRRVPYAAVLQEFKAFHYIPMSIRKPLNQRGFSKKFLGGWCLIFQAVDYILTNQNLSKSIPSTHNISELINKTLLQGSKDLTEQRSNFQFYLDNNGKVEFALDALVALLQIECQDGNKRSGICFHRYPDALKWQATPLDDDFDLPRLMLAPLSSII